MAENKLHEGHRGRLRQKFIDDPSSLEEHELLDLLLFYAIAQKDTNKMAHRMINTMSTAHDLYRAHPMDIVNACGVTERTAVLIRLVYEISRRYSSESNDEVSQIKLDSSTSAGKYIANSEHFKMVSCEHFYMFCLNSQKSNPKAVLVQKGSLDEVWINIRTVVELALRHKAHSVILAHNHPGGSLKPSKADVEMTKSIQNALGTINIDVNDHFIIADGKYFSMREHNLF